MLNPLNLLIRFASLTRIELFAMNLLMLCLQERLTSKDQKISENFYVRGDGTVSSIEFIHYAFIKNYKSFFLLKKIIIIINCSCPNF